MQWYMLTGYTTNSPIIRMYYLDSKKVCISSAKPLYTYLCVSFNNIYFSHNLLFVTESNFSQNIFSHRPVFLTDAKFSPTHISHGTIFLTDPYFSSTHFSHRPLFLTDPFFSPTYISHRLNFVTNSTFSPSRCSYVSPTSFSHGPVVTSYFFLTTNL